MNITARVTENIQLGVRKLAAAIPTITDAEIKAGLELATIEARGGWPGGGIQGYNVPLAIGQRSVRTGALGASSNWHIEGKSYRFESNAYSLKGYPYSADVLGDGNGQGQKPAFAGRWPTAFSVMQKWAKTMLNNIDRKLGQVVAEIK